MVNSEVKTYDLNMLEKLGLYSKDLIERLRRNQYDYLKENFTLEELNNWDIMGPILYAIRNEFNTYIIYKYCGEDIQKDPELSYEVIANEIKLIEGTILSKDKEFIKRSININPNIVLYMSVSLKKDKEFLKECILTESIGIEQIKNIIKENPDLSKDNSFMIQAIKKDASMILLCDDVLKNDYSYMEKICKENDLVINYVASNTNEFCKEALQASKDVLVDISSINVINGFKEELNNINRQIEQATKEGKNDDEIKKLIQRTKQLQRHIKLFERIIAGEVDAVKITKLIDKFCRNIQPEYKEKINQLMVLDTAICEREKENMENINFNTGKVVDIILPEQYEQAALDFSEGNESLRKLLLDCFKRGIQTRACCAGHDESKAGKKQQPFISFNFNEENMGTIMKIIRKLYNYEGINMTFIKEPGLVSSFTVYFPKENANEYFDLIREASIEQEEVRISDIAESMQTVISIMKNHSIPSSYLNIDYENSEENKKYILGIKREDYPEVVDCDEDVALGIEGTICLEDADKKGYLKAARIATRNAKYRRETKYDAESINKIINSDEFKSRFSFDAQGTRESRSKNSNVICVKASLGVFLEDVAHISMELHKSGQPVKTLFNSFVIDTRDYESEQDIIDAYEKARDEYRSKRLLESGIEATETTRIGKINDVSRNIRTGVKGLQIEHTKD